MLNRVFLVMIGGGVGSGARLVVTGYTRRVASSWFTDAFWVGTLAVNISGCFVFGLCAGLYSTKFVGENWRLFLLTGICGGYTTFSAFTGETAELIAAGRAPTAIANVAFQVVAGLIAFWAGDLLAQRLT